MTFTLLAASGSSTLGGAVKRANASQSEFGHS